MPASSSTSSLQTIRLPVRRASAIESDGRALTSTPSPSTRVAKKMPSRTSVIWTSASSWPVAVSRSFIRSCVSGRGGTTPCWAKAIAVASTAPTQIGQVALPRRLAQEHERLVGGHLHPDSDDIDLAHAVSLLSRVGQPKRGGASGSASAQAGLDQRGVQADGQRPELGRGVGGAGGRVVALAARHRVDDLLDQPDLAVGRGLEGPDVARLEPERR